MFDIFKIYKIKVNVDKDAVQKLQEFLNQPYKQSLQELRANKEKLMPTLNAIGDFFMAFASCAVPFTNDKITGYLK